MWDRESRSPEVGDVGEGGPDEEMHKLIVVLGKEKGSSEPPKDAKIHWDVLHRTGQRYRCSILSSKTEDQKRDMLTHAFVC